MAYIKKKKPALAEWREVATELPPEKIEVQTMVNRGRGKSQEQVLRRKGEFWFFPDWTQRVYFAPTHWRYAD